MHLQGKSGSRRFRRLSLWRGQQGQSLIEVALLVPVVAFCMLYAVDFGYFFLVASSLSSSSRSAAEYSVQGPDSVQQSTIPSGSSINSLALADLGSLLSSSTKTSVEVCLNSTTNATTSCTMYGPSDTSAKTDVDPEGFQLNRVDVIYTIQPPISLGVLGSLGVPTKFRRTVEMRVI